MTTPDVLDGAEIERIVAGLSEAESRVIECMSDPEFVRRTSDIADYTFLCVSDVRKVLRHFRDLGIAKYGPLYDVDEGFPRGSGTFLNRSGLAVLKAHLARTVRPLVDGDNA